MEYNDFPQPTFWLIYGELVWFMAFCVVCISVAFLVVLAICIPKSRIQLGVTGLFALIAVSLFPVAIPDHHTDYSELFRLNSACLGLVLIVCSVKPFIAGSGPDKLRVATKQFGCGLFLLGMMAGLWPTILPEARVNNRITECKNRLKLIGLAIDNRSSTFMTGDDVEMMTSQHPVSWRVLLLPFIDHASLKKKYDDNSAWDSHSNLEVAQTRVDYLICPSARPNEDSQKRQFASYVLITGNGTQVPNDAKFDAISLNSSNHSALVIEACGQQIVWTEPRDVDVSIEKLNLNQRGSRPLESPSIGSSLHPRGVNVLFADGRVRTLPLNTDSKVLRSLLTKRD